MRSGALALKGEVPVGASQMLCTSLAAGAAEVGLGDTQLSYAGKGAGEGTDEKRRRRIQRLEATHARTPRKESISPSSLARRDQTVEARRQGMGI